MIQKFKEFGALFEGAPIFVPPNFVKFYLFILAYAKNLLCLA